MIKLEGQLQILDRVDLSNRKWAKDCKISFPVKVPVMYDFRDDSTLLGIAEIFQNDHGLGCKVTLNEETPIDECYVGGYYGDIESHFEGSIEVIDSCRLISMSVVPDDQVADRNLKIRRITGNERRRRAMFMISIKGRTHRCNDVDTAADIIFGETGDERDYERMKYIMGNMKFDELFHGENCVIQCYKEDDDDV